MAEPVKGPQVNTNNPISALSGPAGSTEFRARHCGFLIPFTLKHTNGRVPVAERDRHLNTSPFHLHHASLIIPTRNVLGRSSYRFITLMKTDGRQRYPMDRSGDSLINTLCYYHHWEIF